MAAGNPAGIGQALRLVPTVNSRLLPWALVPLFVLICYQFDWLAWRSLVRDATMHGLWALGFGATPVGATALTFNGGVYLFTIACTAMDACFGAIPFFLTGRWSSMMRLAACFAGVAAANIGRQILGLVLLSEGVPWWLGHEALAGVFYFVLLRYILAERQRT